jgi:sterol desaturase/sphingolipid hydroxylase (fatty acid hydroxylase superfamily)
MLVVALPLAYALLAAMVFLPLEELFPYGEPTRTERHTDVLFATVGAVLAHGLLAVVTGAVLALGQWVGPGLLADQGLLVTLPLGLLLFELTGYGYHRAAHGLPGLRALHDVHHSAEDLDWLAGFRQHPVELVLSTVVQNLPLVLLGLPVASHGLLVMALRVHALFVHANLAVPAWLDPVVTTPRFHRRHHARDLPTANYAVLFPWLDRLFGTWDGAPANDFGLPNRPRKGFLGWLLHPLRRREANPAPDGAQTARGRPSAAG